MVEWPGVTPDYIGSHWTEELLRLMVDSLTARKNQGKTPPTATGAGEDRVVSDSELFRTLGNKVKVVKHGA